jgi:outer membrane receptor for ferrienterochelin and colicins
MRIKLTVLLCIMMCTATFAQTSSISGTVVDATTQQPLMGTNIVVRGTNTGAVTDVNGRYSLGNLEPGTYTLNVIFMGYETISREIVLHKEQI